MPSLSAVPRRIAAGLASPLNPRQYLALINPLWGEQLCARVTAITRPGPDAVTLTLMPGHGWHAPRPGQYVRLGVDIGGVRHWRCYSVCSAVEPGVRAFSVTIGRVDGGRVSGWLQDGLAVGDVIAVDLPQGDFVLPEGELPPLLFISAGTGITPMMSMLRTLRARGEYADVVHLHYAPDAERCLFADELANYDGRGGMRVHRLFTRAGDGHFSAAQLERFCHDWRQREVYVCGPVGLMAAVREHWQASDLAARLHEESFQPPRVEVEGGAGGRVRFWQAGREVDGAGDKPLLEVAEEAGLLPEHGCRMGICQGCLVTLREGRVRDLTTGDIHGEPGDMVRICVCAAAGDVTLDI